jgi:hypothetical protein
MQCQSWAQFKRDFLSELPRPGPTVENYIFRGQADARWAIASSFDRKCPPEVRDRRAYYQKMLAFFAYQLRQYGEDLDGKSRADKAAIAQHYGMPTRLVDWSRSPYVAAFMAFNSAIIEGRARVGGRVAIWAADLTIVRELCGGPEAEFRVIRTRLIENDRIWRQFGLFIEATGHHGAFDEWIAGLSSGDDRTDSALIKYTIPAIEARAAINDLILMGLTPASVFPDRDGAAQYVKLRLALDRLDGDEATTT